MASDTVASQKDGRTSTVQLLSKIPGQRTGGREQLCLTCRGQLPGVDSMLERHFQLSGCPSGRAWWRASSHSTKCCLNPNTVTSSCRDSHCFGCGIKQGGNAKSAVVQEPAGASSATAALQRPACGTADSVTKRLLPEELLAYGSDCCLPCGSDCCAPCGSDCCAPTGSFGSTPLWDHRLWQRKRESPGT